MPEEPTTLFARLRDAAAPHWDAYSGHRFVRGLADGTLPEAAFRHYLTQDYLFLIQFARAYALAAFKADTVEDMRAASAVLSAIVDVEMDLHVEFCAEWGLSEDAMAGVPEDMATTAYTRYVLDCGMRGDVLDLMAALVPCVVGYAEIGRALDEDPATRRAGNPYTRWIAMYASDDYLRVARDAVDQLDRLAERLGGEARFATLSRVFTQATRLEIAFWDMGWAAGEG
jgi:thiaminase/transcriptional activator TenA